MESTEADQATETETHDETHEGTADQSHPAAAQADAATAMQKVITGEHGMEQVPNSSLRDGITTNTPVATSAPPPELQSGVPLAEDRAAGVSPGESSTLGQPGDGRVLPTAPPVELTDEAASQGSV